MLEIQHCPKYFILKLKPLQFLTFHTIPTNQRILTLTPSLFLPLSSSIVTRLSRHQNTMLLGPRMQVRTFGVSTNLALFHVLRLQLLQLFSKKCRVWPEEAKRNYSAGFFASVAKIDQRGVYVSR